MNIWLKILLAFLIMALINTWMIGFSVISQKKQDERKNNRRRPDRTNAVSDKLKTGKKE